MLMSEFMKFKCEETILNRFNIDLASHLFFSRVLAKVDVIVANSILGPSYSTLPPLTLAIRRVYFSPPTRLTLSSTYFIKVFNKYFWFSIFLVYSALLIFLFIYKYLKKLSFNQINEAILHIVGVSSETISYSTISFSFSVVTFLFLFYILSECFSTFLTSKLSIVNDPNLPFETLEDLSKQSTYKICSAPHFHVHSALQESKIYDHILDPKECEIVHERLASTDADISPICSNTHLTIIIQENQWNQIRAKQRLPCPIIGLKPKYFVTFNSFQIGRIFPFKNQFRIFITKMRTSSIIGYFDNNFVWDDMAFEDENVIEITFDHIYLIIVIYGISIVVSMMVLFIEFIIYNSEY